jgi:hypothetical protein
LCEAAVTRRDMFSIHAARKSRFKLPGNFEKPASGEPAEALSGAKCTSVHPGNFTILLLTAKATHSQL